MTVGAVRELVGNAKPVKLPEPDRSPQPRVQTAADFLNAFRPIESLVDALPIPRGGLVAITGPTGHGKTTVSCLLEVSLVAERRFAGRDTLTGAVLVLAGENPDDYAMHLAATLQDLGLPPPAKLLIVPGVFDISAELDRFTAIVQGAGVELLAVFVDTSAAYNLADDENDNVAMRRHASMLRELTTLPGKPTVFVLCHPVKNAQRDNLIPRGGGSFLAEVDANLTCWKDDAGIVALHWAGKIRGAPFEPVRFELVPIELAGQRDSRGRPIFSVAARHVPDERAEQLQAKEIDDEDRLLVAMQKKPGGSTRELALQCGWTSGTGQPHHMRVVRRLKVLEGHGLVDQDRHGTWRLTPKGKKEADKLP